VLLCTYFELTLSALYLNFVLTYAGLFSRPFARTRRPPRFPPARVSVIEGGMAANISPVFRTPDRGGRARPAHEHGEPTSGGERDEPNADHASAVSVVASTGRGQHRSRPPRQRRARSWRPRRGRDDADILARHGELQEQVHPVDQRDQTTSRMVAMAAMKVQPITSAAGGSR
jgi:hypothetical protein